MHAKYEVSTSYMSYRRKVTTKVKLFTTDRQDKNQMPQIPLRGYEKINWISNTKIPNSELNQSLLSYCSS